MPFKFDSRTFFLTYPNSGELTREEVQQHLQSLAAVDWIRIALERHQSGEPHIHAVGRFSARFQTRNERCFDIQGRHPNIQPCRSVKQAVAYVSKDAEFIDVGTVPESGDPDATDWLAAAATMSEGDFFRAAMQARVSYMYADRFWRMARARTVTEIPVGYTGDLQRECFELQVHLPDECKATVVVGPTGCGKTSWAKRVCSKPSLWVRHLDKLRDFRADYHKSIVFDDMSFTHLPRETQIHITDFHDEAQIHCRYGVAIIPAGIQKIFTCNSFCFSQDPAILRRIHTITVLGFSV